MKLYILDSIISFILVCLCINIIESQPINKYIDDVVPPSVNEASLGKYLDIPVGHYTGTPNITVPIHTISQGPISDNIFLSYHAGGIKLEETASRVGLGWSLNAGGYINRTVLGLKDEDFTLGYYHNGDNLDELSADEVEDLGLGQLDGEPDLFNFNVGGFTGHFYFNKDQEPVLVQKQDIKILVNYSGSTFTGFIITTPDGNRHYFGEYDASTAYNYTRLPDVANPYISTWHLLRTETYDKTHHLSYGYEIDNYSFTSTATCRFQDTECDSPGPGGGWSVSTTCSTNTGYIINSREYRYVKIDIEGKRLNSISSDEVSISFISSEDRDDLGDSSNQTTDKKSLDTIEIITGTGTTYCKRYIFDYDYFIDENHDEDQSSNAIPAAWRLKLLSVTEKSCDNSISKPPFSFSYNENYLPWRHSRQIDHWGYYNARSNNDNNMVNVPETILEVSGNNLIFGNSDRETYESFMRSGVLDTIFYPTGGYSTFEYEANRYTTDIETEDEVHNMLNCIVPTTMDCCGSPDIEIDTINFEESEIGNPRLNLTVEIIEGAGVCGDTSASVHLTVTRISDSEIIFSEGFNISSPVTKYTEFFNSEYFDELEDNTDYQFLLEVTDGRGEVEMFNIDTIRDDRLVGGLRIAQTKMHDGIDTNNDIIKTYEYLAEDEESSGVLLWEPEYGYVFTGYTLPLFQGQYTLLTTAIFSTSSFVPMSSYENNQLGYERVREYHNSNGWLEYQYRINPLSIVGTPPIQYPYPPPGYEEENGRETERKVFSEDSTIVSKSSTIPYGDTDMSISIGKLYRVSELFQCDIPNSNGIGIINEFKIPSSIYRPDSIITILDGVSTVTNFGYDISDRYYEMDSKTVTNSDGKKYHTIYTFPHDVTGSVYDSLVSLNVIKPVVITHKVGGSPSSGGTVIDGTTIEYGEFTTAFGTYPYPENYLRREVTWNNSSILDDGDVLQATIDEYDSDTGYPSEITIVGWDSIEYSWNSNGTLASKTFLDYMTTYQYHNGTTFLSELTNVDGTSSSYTYDQLFRLESMTDDCRNVTSSLIYNYGDPSSGGNNIITIIDYPEVTDSDLDTIRNKQFFDGLGRSIQLIKEDQGPDSNDDVVIAQAYDEYGRIVKQYEPIAIDGNNGEYAEPQGGWDFTENQYEESPLNRLTGTKPPQWYWTYFEYGTNASGEVIDDHSMSSTFSDSLLFKKTTIDENDNLTIEFTDRLGRSVLSRRVDSGQTDSIDTYTVYDDKSRPIMILPPATTLSTPKLLFEYEYYGDDQVYFKKLPDQDTIFHVYNARDLLAYTQDGERKLEDLWYTSIYDDYGREVFAGLEDDSPGSNNSFANATVEDTLKTMVYGSSGIEIDKLISKSNKLLSSPEIINSQMEYDTCGRITKIYGNSLLQIEDDSSHVFQFTYDWADNVVLETQTTQDVRNSSNQVINRNKYDHAGRLFEEYATIDTFSEQFLCHKDFDGKDLVSQMKLGGSLGSPLQQVDYAYLPNQFLQKINDPTSPGSDLFAMQLHYDTPYSGTSPTVRKNGDIINTVWKVKDQNLQVYSFEYDYLNRINSSDYKEPSNGSADDRYNTSYSYDDRGNITSLTRYGGYDNGGSIGYGQIDNLSYSYVTNSNQIESISEGAPNSGGYLGSANDYVYDENGSVTFDPSRGVDIARNILNLPDTIFTDTTSLRFFYDAESNLYRKTSYEDTLVRSQRDYIGQMEFLNGRLDFIHHSNGFMKVDRGLEEEHLILTGSQDQDSIYNALTIYSNQHVEDPAEVEYRIEEYVLFHPEFQVDSAAEFLAIVDTFPPTGIQYFFALKDHLGSNRLVFMDEDDSGTIDTAEIFSENHQYPFGLDFYGQFYERNNTFEYNYNGKELVEELDLGYYNYGARFYDPSIGRFHEVDKFGEKYSSLSSYQYGANNPIKFIDINGDSIDLSVLIKINEILGRDIVNTIKNDLEHISGLKLSIGENGHLTYAKDEKGEPIFEGGSKEARNFLTSSINKTSIVKIGYSPKRSFYVTGKSEIAISDNQIEGFIKGTSPDLDSRTMGYGMTFLHEIDHSPIGSGDIDSKDLGTTGPVVDRMNRIRSEMGFSWGQRLSYPSYQLSPRSRTSYIPFSRISLESIERGLVPINSSVKIITPK